MASWEDPKTIRIVSQLMGCDSVRQAALVAIIIIIIIIATTKWCSQNWADLFSNWNLSSSSAVPEATVFAYWRLQRRCEQNSELNGGSHPIELMQSKRWCGPRLLWAEPNDNKINNLSYGSSRAEPSLFEDLIVTHKWRARQSHSGSTARRDLAGGKEWGQSCRCRDRCCFCCSESNALGFQSKTND